MVQAGDRVKVQGREATVTSSWGQGKHTVWSLDDGTTVMDLAEKVAAGQAEVLAAPEPVEEPRLTRRQRRERDSTPGVLSDDAEGYGEDLRD